MYDEAIVWRRDEVKVPSDFIRSPNSVSIRFIEEFFDRAFSGALKITPRTQCRRFDLCVIERGTALHELEIDFAHSFLLFKDIFFWSQSLFHLVEKGEHEADDFFFLLNTLLSKRYTNIKAAEVSLAACTITTGKSRSEILLDQL